MNIRITIDMLTDKENDNDIRRAVTDALAEEFRDVKITEFRTENNLIFPSILILEFYACNGKELRDCFLASRILKTEKEFADAFSSYAGCANHVVILTGFDTIYSGNVAYEDAIKAVAEYFGITLEDADPSGDMLPEETKEGHSTGTEDVLRIGEEYSSGDYLIETIPDGDRQKFIIRKRRDVRG